VEEVLRLPGRPLDAGTRTAMGAAFGFDFGRVRVHDDARAAESARAVDAVAYTVGSHIVFGSGQGAGGPGRDGPASGQRLLAHELAHVVQQRGRSTAGPLTVGSPGTGEELQADAAAATVAAGGAIPVLAPLRAGPEVQRQQIFGEVKVAEGEDELASRPPGLGDVQAVEGERERILAGAGSGDVKVAEDLLMEVERILGGGVQYQAGEGDTLLGIADRFGTTAAALMRANELKSQEVRPGQRLKVPPVAGCGLKVPTSLDTQLLAGVIFAEASPKVQSNDEREAIAWAFVNSVEHTKALCSGVLECPGASETRMKDQCDIDRKSLGITILESIQRGSLAYGKSRWNMVMTGDVLLPAGNLCMLPSRDEVTAMARAIEAAEAVMSGSATRRDYLRFNRADNSPPNPKRQEQAGRHEGHTFYRFKPGSECG
jgi:LysM repeat protein